MKVLFVTSEANPFVKTGGLGDVMGALPQSLHNLGVDARVVLPKHKNIKGDYVKNISIASTMGPGIKVENNFDK